MRRVWGAGARALLLLLLARLPPPGDGNEGSITGSCPCDRIFSSDSPPSAQIMDHLQQHLKAYHRCPRYIRFQLPLRSVCGGPEDRWVRKLIGCFDGKECGSTNSKSREHLPLPSTQIPEPTGIPDPSDIGQTFLPSSLHPTFLPAAPSLDKELTNLNETTTPIVGHSLGVRPEAGENQKQLEENAGFAAGTSAVVPVLTLLVIIFILIGVLLYVLCKRRREQSLKYFPDSQLHYTPVTPDSNA
ncbi:C-X-C motif chemokine 16 [Cynocephalus volans]|uniref:C-X-C motif chemokine 16 n=1 Tax=Cynocephalus volans TaxID=110931 RepID=UPI002FCB1C4A